MSASGFLWTPYTTLRGYIAASTRFQTWVGAENQDAALASIFLFEQFSDISANRYAVIDQGQPLLLTRASAGVGLAAFDWRSSVTFGFCERVPAYSEASVGNFLTNVGNFLDDVLGVVSAQTQELKELDFALKFPRGDSRGFMKFFTLGTQV
jgi:hypothetical protein